MAPLTSNVVRTAPMYKLHGEGRIAFSERVGPGVLRLTRFLRRTGSPLRRKTLWVHVPVTRCLAKTNLIVIYAALAIVSLRELHAGDAHDLRPFRNLLGDDGREFLRRRDDRLDAELAKARAHLRRSQSLVDRGIEPLDHRRRCAGGRHDAE